jgi:hypothetical protein
VGQKFFLFSYFQPLKIAWLESGGLFTPPGHPPDFCRQVTGPHGPDLSAFWDGCKNHQESTILDDFFNSQHIYDVLTMIHNNHHNIKVHHKLGPVLISKTGGPKIIKNCHS